LIFRFWPFAWVNAARRIITTDKNDSLFMLLNYQVAGLDL
jgi:hypothetical protein